MLFVIPIHVTPPSGPITLHHVSIVPYAVYRLLGSGNRFPAVRYDKHFFWLGTMRPLDNRARIIIDFDHRVLNSFTLIYWRSTRAESTMLLSRIPILRPSAIVGCAKCRISLGPVQVQTAQRGYARVPIMDEELDKLNVCPFPWGLHPDSSS